MAFYESVYIARQDLSNQQVEALTEQMSAVLTDNGAKIEKTEQWGLRSLAYRINKNRKGHYTQLTIDGPSAAVQELERQMGLNEDILRSLTLRIDAIDMEPSAILQAKAGRDDRPRRDDRDDRPRRDAAPAAPAAAAPESKGEE